MADRKVLIFHDYDEYADRRSLQQRINQDIEEKWPGYTVHSATTAVATCRKHNGHIYVQWCSTVVIEEKEEKKKRVRARK